MTLEEAIVEVYEATDEQSDLDPYVSGTMSLTTTGATRIMGLLNRAQDAIATWKFPNGRRLRFRCLEDTAVVTMTVPTYNAVSDSTDGIVTFAGGFDGTGNAYAGWIALHDDSPYVIVGSNVDSITIAGPTLPVVTAADAVKLTKQYWSLKGDGADVTMPWRLIEVVEMYDIGNDMPLSVGLSRDRGAMTTLGAGDVGEWVNAQKGVRFDVAPDATVHFIVRGYRYPTAVAALSDAFEIPEAFHEAICEYAKYTANSRIGKIDNAAMAWARCEKLMFSLRTEDDIESDFLEGRMYVEGV